MKTLKHDSPRETSVVLALAELGRLERNRADFADAKRSARERLGRQAQDIERLRGELLAERPRAWDRSRREQTRRRRLYEREAAATLAQTELEHRERLARYGAEIELRRRQLEMLDSTPIVVRPGRRILEWSLPAAATALVAFLGFMALGEDHAVARAAIASLDEQELVHAQDRSLEARADRPELEAETAPAIETVSDAEPEDNPEPKPEAKPEAKPEPKPEAKAESKPKPKPKPEPKDEPKPESKPKPDDSKRSNPLVLEDFDGNPLGM